jgi:hypothetical protein
MKLFSFLAFVSLAFLISCGTSMGVIDAAGSVTKGILDATGSVLEGIATDTRGLGSLLN